MKIIKIPRKKILTITETGVPITREGIEVLQDRVPCKTEVLQGYPLLNTQTFKNCCEFMDVVMVAFFERNEIGSKITFIYKEHIPDVIKACDEAEEGETTWEIIKRALSEECEA